MPNIATEMYSFGDIRWYSQPIYFAIQNNLLNSGIFLFANLCVTADIHCIFSKVAEYTDILVSTDYQNYYLLCGNIWSNVNMSFVGMISIQHFLLHHDIIIVIVSGWATISGTAFCKITPPEEVIQLISIGYTPRLRFLWDLLTERRSREVYKCHSNRNRGV